MGHLLLSHIAQAKHEIHDSPVVACLLQAVGVGRVHFRYPTRQTWKLSMTELRAKRLTNAREDGQDRYHEARHAASACRATKNGVETRYPPRTPASPKSNRGFWVGSASGLDGIAIVLDHHTMHEKQASRMSHLHWRFTARVYEARRLAGRLEARAPRPISAPPNYDGRRSEGARRRCAERNRP